MPAIQMRVWRAVLLEIAIRLLLILSPLLAIVIYVTRSEYGPVNWAQAVPYLGRYFDA